MNRRQVLTKIGKIGLGLGLGSLGALAPGCITVTLEPTGITGGFSSIRELENTLKAAEEGGFVSGPWKGLGFHTCSVSDLSGINDYIHPNSKPILNFLYEIIGQQESWHDLLIEDKVGALFFNFQSRMRYKPNPFDQLELINSWDLPEEHQEKARAFYKRYRNTMIGIQTPEETLHFRTGDCEDLALLFTSLVRAAGINSGLELASLGNNTHHIISSYGFEGLVDPTVRGSFTAAKKAGREYKNNPSCRLTSI